MCQINLENYHVAEAMIRDTPERTTGELQLGYGYQIEKSGDEEQKKYKGVLRLIVNSDEGKEKPEDSALFISAVVVGNFTVIEDAGAEEIKKESLRQLFPYARAYITQLTSLSQWQPMYLPLL